MKEVAKNIGPFLQKYGKWILLLIVILIVFTNVRRDLRRARWKREANASLGPNGTGVWDPYREALILYEAMKSNPWDPSTWGTDEDAIFMVLENKTPQQLAALYNEFGLILQQNDEDGDLLSWLSDDLSGSELSRALGYFDGISFN